MTDEKEPDSEQDPKPAPEKKTPTTWYESVGLTLLIALCVAGLAYLVGRVAWEEQDRKQRRIDDCKIDGLVSVEGLDGMKTCVEGWNTWGDGTHLREWKAAVEECTDRGGRPVRGAQNRWEVVCVDVKPRSKSQVLEDAERIMRAGP
jgi:hypothetical protein